MACVTLAEEDEICLVDINEETVDADQRKFNSDAMIDIETGDDKTVNKIMQMRLIFIFKKMYTLTKISLIWINRKIWYIFSSAQNVFVCRNDLINIE